MNDRHEFTVFIEKPYQHTRAREAELKSLVLALQRCEMKVGHLKRTFEWEVASNFSKKALLHAVKSSKVFYM
jgi:hypothetical protein